jgi:hypothetical protein
MAEQQQSEQAYWLIERRCTPPQYSRDGCAFFVSDHMHAKRFPTKEAAMTAMRIWHATDRTDCFAAEHADVELPHVVSASRWASPSLGRAYAEVERLRDSLAQPGESGIDETLRRALEAIETADCEIGDAALASAQAAK